MDDLAYNGHMSDCAVHNGPAFRNGLCSCGFEQVVALYPFANLKADDGDDFSKWAGDIVIRYECTVDDITRARNAIRNWGKPRGEI